MNWGNGTVHFSHIGRYREIANVLVKHGFDSCLTGSACKRSWALEGQGGWGGWSWTRHPSGCGWPW